MSEKKHIVSLDIETTGLSPERDAVIEVGLIRFRGDREEARWSSFVHPGCRIPPAITQLTGITDAMVSDAPPIKALIPQIREFAGGDPILGHNVAFDIAFFRKHRLFQDQDVLDSLELASALLPRAPRYNLGALCSHLGIPVSPTHRALDDALAAYALYRRLAEIACGLPTAFLAEMVRFGQNVKWGGGALMEEAYAARLKEEGALAKTPGVRFPIFESQPVFGRRDDSQSGPEPPLPREEPEPLDPEAMAALLDTRGPFGAHFPGYERRTQQMEMTAAVSQAFSQGSHLMVEAGTGTGKSLAYLIPAVHWALKNGERVVVSTNTINLQDQLLKKDFPDLVRVLKLEARAAALKGRSNYICPRKFEALRRRGPENADEMRVLAKTVLWLTESESGDRSEINLNGPAERAVWAQLSAEDELCSPEGCYLFRRKTCPFLRARVAAEYAHVLIVNHALLVADVAAENRVLPEYRYLVVDEGHQLEAAATDGLSFRCSWPDLERSLRELGNARSGWLGMLTARARKGGADKETAAFLRARIGDLEAAVESAARTGKAFFGAIDQFVFSQIDGPPKDFALQYRLIPAVRTLPGWENVEEAWDNMRADFTEASRIAAAIAERIHGAGDEEENSNELPLLLAGWAGRVGQTVESIHKIIAKPDPQRIHWVEIPRDRDVRTLYSAPLHVGPLVEKHLWHAKHSVVLTSATLTAAGEFDYLRERLNADEADTLVVGSPFDFENSALLYLVTDIPEPGNLRAYQHALNRALVELCQATRGRALVLFTSYSQLRQTAQVIQGPLSRAGIVVYEQGEGASRHALLETFKSAEQAVLLGTRSFWEGVDVPGQALSVLALTKLPFDVPSDPIVAARGETFEDSFQQYSLPEAILRFRQGFGRLIRTKTDRGVAVVFDRRIMTKSYGRAFMDSLPECTREQGPLADLPARAARWLGE
ncbi:MAG: DEAD/DEAH box helicase [Anaerolineales bacterium]|nr:DEAD/DEAH box helicase [Anaerolineales bacterium]